MNISDISEFAFIERLSSSFAELLPRGFTGIGDDCALFPKSAQESYAVSTDLLIENHHFYRNKIPPYSLGIKSLAVNLSDIAAMGAEPMASFLSVGLPKDISMDWLDSFTAGYKALSLKENVPLCGGDTTASPHICVSVTVIGFARNEAIRRRSMARAGDIICCTSNLGDSGGGFLVLQSDIETGADEDFLLKRHYEPYPEIAAGKWLASRRGAGAMMDISDGLVSDLEHILAASGAAAFLNLEAIPLSAQLKRCAERHGWDSLDLALNGGEDYCLLLTVAKDEFAGTSEKFFEAFGRPLFPIGGIEPMMSGGGKIRFLQNGKETAFTGKPFRHFR
ncbi:MAG: thiamine-phosphate kinase [Spirochaetia bacterium]|jgi:thiamine-monophosphate kinase|nr:thiamine-phosphate kinase [Spirochaetia bacterium]